MGGSGRLQLCYGPFVPVLPFCRRQIPPAHATREEIFTAVLHHVEKRFIGLNNLTFEVPDEDPDNVGVDQAPDLGFALFEIPVKTGILQGDRGLRRKQFQHCDPGRSENVRGQVIFEVEDTDKFGLVDQRQAEN